MSFWAGFMTGAAVNALLVIAFVWWSDRPAKVTQNLIRRDAITH